MLNLLKHPFGNTITEKLSFSSSTLPNHVLMKMGKEFGSEQLNPLNKGGCF
ncbi:ribonucleotide reductase beta subunit [Candidatus Brocadia sinica JPN1]|uniref:Ribonucleotide reductase beta subunit n=1 Tax=Candidatus Brocadia sinica JPN1 TaxID=1197129 RepID=A0ABQ0JZ13_9BACT|nr:ribonucleotide reductase beta subunit [Candidatus Brocadia sinica JPN1]